VGLSGPSAWSPVEYVKVGGGWLGSFPVGRLRDSGNSHGDTLRMLSQGSSKGGLSIPSLDPVANGLLLRVGPMNAPVTVSIPPGDSRWTSRGGRLRWRSGSGATPRVEVWIATKNDRCSSCFSVRVSRFDFTEAPSERVELLGVIGSETGGVLATWNPRGRGVLRHR
jgi:hypothetical protein